LTGQWNGFGGKVERGLDLSIADSAARELLEEAFLEAPLFPVGFVQWVVSPPESTSSKGGSGEQAKGAIYRDVMIVYKAHSFTFQQPKSTTTSASFSSTDTTSSPEVNLQEEFLASDEMAPAWWPVSGLPWDQMRINHKVWYPLMLADRTYRAVYWYQTHFSDYDQEKAGAQDGGGAKTGARETNAQRETAKEIWVEDLEKRCVQFGPEVWNRSQVETLPVRDVQPQQIQQHEDQRYHHQQQQEQVRLDEFAKALGLLMRDDGRTHYGQSAKTKSETIKSPDPIWCKPLDENWMGQAIAKVEKDWLVALHLI